MMNDRSGGLMSPSPPDRAYEKGAAMKQPGSSAKFSQRERVLFPLPLFACPGHKTGVSRPVKQRRHRIRKVTENCNEAIRGLNWLAGCYDYVEKYCELQHCSPLHQEVMMRVDGLVRDQKPSGIIDSPEAALRSLLRGGSPYDLAVSSETLAPYRDDLLSVPHDVHGCPRLLDVLPAQDCQFLEEVNELMLRRDDEVEVPPMTPYWDPVLRHNRSAYRKLVRRLHSIGYFTYTLEPKCKVGVFFVWKSSRTKLRMITDARPANRLFLEPPGVSLMTGEGLGRIEVVCDDTIFADISALDNLEVFIGLSDVKDCFHRMRVPSWLARYFAWDAVTAATVGMTGVELEGKVLAANDLIFPCAGSLCQGFSWSLYFAQKANEYLAGSISPLTDAKLASDRGGPVILHVSKDVDSSAHFYVYVDNLGVISVDESEVKVAMEELQACFNSKGLELHGSEITQGSVEALGCVLDGNRMRSRCNAKRLWRVHHGIKGLLNRGRCSGKALEIVIGHCTFLGLISRGSLACFHSVYSFIQKNYGQVASLWQSVVNELTAFMGLCFLLVQDWWRPWNRLVTSSDSSLVGYGACKSWWPKDLVAESGRVQERSRFRRRDSHSARESALVAAGFHLKGTTWSPVDEKTMNEIAESGWEVVDDFPEIPSGALKRNLWTPVFWGKWEHKENIGILEARTILKSIKRVCMTRYGHDIRHLHLSDNLGVVLSIERYRSRNFKVLKVIRCIAAYCFSRNVQLAIRWIPSELNVSDEPSRIHDPSDSKLLVDLVVAGDFERFSPQSSPLPHANATSEKATEPSPCERTSRQATADCDQVQDPQPDSSIGSDAQVISRSEEDPGSGICDWKTEGWEGQTSLPAQVRKGVSSLVGQEEVRGGVSGGVRQRQHVVRSEGRARRRMESHIAKQAKKTTAEKGGLADVWERAWKEHPGDGGHICKGPRKLHSEVGRTFEVGQIQGCELGQCGSFGFNACGTLRPEISGRRGCSLWGLHVGLPHGHETGVQPDGRQEDPKSLAVTTRMAQVVPISLETCLPIGSLGGFELADGCARPSQQSCVQPAPGLFLPSARHFAEAEEVGPSEAHCWGDHALVDPHEPERDFRCFEGWDERRQCDVGLGVDSVHHTSAVSPCEGASYGSCLGLHLWRVPGSLQPMRIGAEDQCSSISGPSFRAKHRQSCKNPRSRRGQKAWRMDDEAERDEIREGRKIGSDMAEARCKHSDKLQVSREVSGRHHARPQLSRHPTAELKRERGYLADFFAGSCGVSRAAQKLGFSTREWELLHGEHADLTKPIVQYKIKCDIQKKLVLAAMLAPPCSSFSRARDRTMVIRTKQFPWGLPDLPPHEQLKVDQGNACFRAALKIIKWLDKYKIPWILENPSSSKAWFIPELVSLQNAAHTHLVETDFCQFGTRWRKRTKLLAGNMTSDDIARCSQLCCGAPGVCDRTGKGHFQLTGSARNGVPWTRIAQPYPKKLCHHLAYALLCPYLMSTANLSH